MTRTVIAATLLLVGLSGCFESHRSEPAPPPTCVPDEPMPLCNTLTSDGFCDNPIVRPPVTARCEWGPCPDGTIPTATCPRFRTDAGR